MKAKFNAGEKVFAKVRGYPYWPARIIGPTDESAPFSKLKYEIVFYGTGEKATVKADDVQSFLEKRHELGKPKKQKAFNDAMAEIESEMSPDEMEAVVGAAEGSQGGQTREVSTGRPPRRSLQEPKTPDLPSSSEGRSRGRKRKSVPEEDLSPNSGTVGRMGRRIKAKRQSVDSALSPAEGSRTPNKRARKSKLEESVEFMLEGETVAIPLTLNRPTLVSPRSCLDWQGLVRSKALALKDDVLAGRLSLEAAVQELDVYTKRLAAEKKDEYRENERQLKLLKVEGRLLQLDVKIKTSLTLAKAGTLDASRHIDEFNSLSITPLMIKKHPEIIETFKRLTRYVGNTSVWSMSRDEKEGFSIEAQTIRTKAQQVLDKITSLFDVPEGQSFYRVFSAELRDFAKSTETLSQEEFYSLTAEPSRDQTTD